MSKPILELTRNITYTDHNWIQSLSHILLENKMKIWVYNTWVPTISRRNDKMLMDIFNNNATNQKILHINYCRLYLQVNTISDITTLKGDCIEEGSWTVKKKTIPSRLQWPLQNRPTKKSIIIWQNALQKLRQIEN